MRFFVIFFILPIGFLYSQSIEDGVFDAEQQPPVRNIIPDDPPPLGIVIQEVVEDIDDFSYDQMDNEPENLLLENIIKVTPGIQIKIIPKLPDPLKNNKYRIQVGAFKNTSYARNCFDSLKSIGFSPSFEQYNDITRVVIPGVAASEIIKAAERIGAAGFSEILLREEN